MREVRQRRKNDCVIAAVANAVGTSYTAVRRVNGRVGLGLKYDEIVWLLEAFGEWRETNPRRPAAVAEWVRRHRAGRYVLILTVFVNEFHAVACVDGRVIGEYDEKWFVSTYWRLQNA